MGKGSKSGGCKSASHQVFKDKAKNRVDDLQGMVTNLQSAMKESRSIDVAVHVEQVNQILREWKKELNEPSPASSLQGGSLGSFSSDICRLLLLRDEEDDATSALAAPKPEPDGQKVSNNAIFLEGFSVNQGPQEQEFQLVDQCKGCPSEIHNMEASNFGIATQPGYHAVDLQQDFAENFFADFDGMGLCGEDGVPQISDCLQNISIPPSAFLGPKCALWDCIRPAQGVVWCQDYCGTEHAKWVLNEGQPGMAPVLRPGGIVLKDSVLFNALRAKAQGKVVGIPECEGAATAKSPWNAPELFDFTVVNGEIIREWLFFDKPRRAFESGNRKQRSLPDYNGRGWHESRKQVMNESGGLKRSYYMDPQPMNNCEWHLFEYQIDKYDACALYRLEFKLVDSKKSPKGKPTNDSVADLQKQMGKLTPSDNKRSAKGRTKANLKDGVGNVVSAPEQITPTIEGFDNVTDGTRTNLKDGAGNVYSALKQMASPSEWFDGITGVPYDYNSSGYYLK
ncbi:transcription factor VOZ1-like isoform X2 [Cornus florida]|uniref:transcription factor VOZ1-like isoform X2 n=1 Tax=Cornus florida TaxID=4283 RepID=UPI00289F907C|nr:transcription factor VOZ1-like isoform X2 [Cornus florida]